MVMSSWWLGEEEEGSLQRREKEVYREERRKFKEKKRAVGHCEEGKIWKRGLEGMAMSSWWSKEDKEDISDRRRRKI
eukprot:7311955-Ditylum_brightwellii.AAC.1